MAEKNEGELELELEDEFHEGELEDEDDADSRGPYHSGRKLWHPTLRKPREGWGTRSFVAVPVCAYKNKGASTSVTVASSLINTCSEGPAVSLNGSPTVSPTTAALCASERLPP
jgi:hypothetical protein